MEEYLLCMKTLRSQMNGTNPFTTISFLFFILDPNIKTKLNFSDVEDQAAKISVEEETQLTNVRTLEKDIDSGLYSLLRTC